MAKKKETMPAVQEAELAMPSFMTGVKPEGYEDVDERTQITSYRISQGLSVVVSEGIMGVGRIYDSEDKVDLGTEREIMIARKRKVRQLMNPEGKSMACKGYNLDTNDHGDGRIRLYNSDDMPDEYLKAWGITDKELGEGNDRVLDFSCAECPFADWKTDGEKRVPPKCTIAHEVFFFDVTDGLDTVPHIFSIVLTSKHAREAASDLDRILIQKLRMKRSEKVPQGLPIYGAILKLKVDRAENARGNRFFVPKFEFARYLTEDDAPQFAMCRKFLEDFNKREAQYREDYDEKTESSSSPMEEQAGNPWGDEEDSASETPWE